MTDTLQETFWVGLALTVSSVVILRLAAASYFLWKEDQQEKTRLTKLHKSIRDRPDQLEREAANAHAIALRTELGELLARCVSIAEIRSQRNAWNHVFVEQAEADFAASFVRIRDLLNALSYDIPLRIAGHELHRLSTTIAGSSTPAKKEDLDRLQSLKKIVFRILYKKDINEVGEIVSLAEIENLLEKDQHPSGEFGLVQKQIRDPEFLGKIRKLIEEGEIG